VNPRGLAPSYDIAAASRLLGSLGFVDRNGDGLLEDPDGGAVRFALLTQKGNTSLERGAWVVSDRLARVGVRVDVVALEVGTLINYVTRGNYDAAYFRLLTTDTDPALNLDFWLSSGTAHVWNPEQHGPPSTWEAELDGLMERIEREQPDLRYSTVREALGEGMPDRPRSEVW